MARRTAAEVFAAARAAGASVAQAVVAVAIGIAESSLDDASVGDVSLETNTWGPSVGIYQIRTLKAETGTGSDRDISALQGNLARQTKAMMNISKNGQDFSPWTTYTRGTYSQFLGQAKAAASAGGGIIPTGLTTQTTGLGDSVEGKIDDYVGGKLNAAVKPARDLIIKVGFVTLGLGVLGFGLYKAFGDQVKSAGSEQLDRMTAL